MVRYSPACSMVGACTTGPEAGGITLALVAEALGLAPLPAAPLWHAAAAEARTNNPAIIGCRRWRINPRGEMSSC